MIVAALPLLFFTLQADTVSRKPPELKFTGDIGYVSTAGNTSVSTLNLGNKFSAKVDDLTLSQTFALVYGESKGTPVTSQTRGSIRVDKGLRTANFSAYTLFNYERNTFAGLASRISVAAGLSAHLVHDDHNKLTLESGFTLTRQRGIGTKGHDADFLGGRAATTYIHLFGPKASVSQTVEVLPNFHQTNDLRVNTESAVVAPITSKVGVKLSYVIRYDGLPEAGFETTDRLFTSGIQISL